MNHTYSHEYAFLEIGKRRFSVNFAPSDLTHNSLLESPWAALVTCEVKTMKIHALIHLCICIFLKMNHLNHCNPLSCKQPNCHLSVTEIKLSAVLTASCIMFSQACKSE